MLILHTSLCLHAQFLLGQHQTRVRASSYRLSQSIQALGEQWDFDLNWIHNSVRKTLRTGWTANQGPWQQHSYTLILVWSSLG